MIYGSSSCCGAASSAGTKVVRLGQVYSEGPGAADRIAAVEAQVVIHVNNTDRYLFDMRSNGCLAAHAHTQCELRGMGCTDQGGHCAVRSAMMHVHSRPGASMCDMACADSHCHAYLCSILALATSEGGPVWTVCEIFFDNGQPVIVTWKRGS